MGVPTGYGMIIPRFYGDGGEQAYFETRSSIERILRHWAGRDLTPKDEEKLDKFMESLSKRKSTGFEDRALESLIEEAHGVNT